MRMHEPYPGVFVFKLFTRAECATLLRGVESLHTKEARSPNSMNKYGMTLSGRGRTLDRFLAALSHYFVRSEKPLAKQPYAFMVDYEKGKQHSLAKHVDSSYMTMNVGLGDTWLGGELVFYDKRGHSVYEVRHEVGQAIVHSGQHAHRAKPITHGTRSNLILWCEQRV